MVDHAREAKGKVWYGMHFYAGLAQYSDPGRDPYRVFLNENTIRSMDPSFAGRPVFVLHVDEVETDINELRKEADGWVVESFYNKADGKHWVKFITVSDKADQAIARGMRLSNCYVPTQFGPSGIWNGIDYNKEITAGEYEHLAIVPNPRYEESVILSPEEFKKYNEEKDIELKRLANNNPSGEVKMKFNFFKRSKVENSTDLEGMLVELPKTKKEVLLAKLINEADEREAEKDKPKIAEPHHLVDVKGNTMTVNDLVEAHSKMCDELEEMKKPKEEEKKDDEKSEDPAAENDDTKEVYEKEVPKSEDDEASEKRSMKLEEEEAREVKDSKKKNDLEAAERLRNANTRAYQMERPTLLISSDLVERGKSLYGSN